MVVFVTVFAKNHFIKKVVNLKLQLLYSAIMPFNLRVKESPFQKISRLTQRLFNFSEKYLHVFD